MTLHAITRAPSPNLAACELTHLDRVAIDAARAADEHAAYESALAELGYEVEQLPAEPDLPDSVFVEDAALVLPEVAVITRPGAASRRPETASVAAALARHRQLASIEAPATIDGGDILHLGRTIFVGRTSRTNAAGIDQLVSIVAPFGYSVQGIEVEGCLHLKSAVSRLDDETVLLNPAWVAEEHFADWRIIHVDPAEPNAANVLALGNTVLAPAGYPRTHARIEEAGFMVRPIDITELAKAEAGMTCSSLILDASDWG